MFTMAFKCVLKILKTCVNFTGLQDEIYLCSRKNVHFQKIDSYRDFVASFYSFQLNKNTRMCTAIFVNSDCISHPTSHTHTHTQTKHTLIYCIYLYIYIYWELVTGFLEEISVSAMRNSRYQVYNYTFLYNYQIAQGVISEDGNESSHRYDPNQLSSLTHVLLTRESKFSK